MFVKTHNIYLEIIIIESEGGWQNIMSFSCMRAVYENTPYLHSRKTSQHSGLSLTTKHCSKPAKNTIKKYHRSNPIRCLAMLKLVHSAFTYKKQFLPMCFIFILANISMKYMHLMSAHTVVPNLFASLCSDKWLYSNPGPPNCTVQLILLWS